MSPMSLDTQGTPKEPSEMSDSILKEDNVCDVIDIDAFEFEDILE